MLLALGSSDCEALHEGWLGQPVNAVSSLAYVVAGAYVLRRGGSAVVASALAAVGVGSLAYHGPMPGGAEMLHDGSIVLLGGAVLLESVRRQVGWPPRAAAVAGAAAVVVNLLSRTDAPLCDPDSSLQGHAAWHVLSAAALAIWLGRAKARGHRPMNFAFRIGLSGKPSWKEEGLERDRAGRGRSAGTDRHPGTVRPPPGARPRQPG